MSVVYAACRGSVESEKRETRHAAVRHAQNRHDVISSPTDTRFGGVMLTGCLVYSHPRQTGNASTHLTSSHAATRDSTISQCPTQNGGRNSFISSAQRFVNNKPRPGISEGHIAEASTAWCHSHSAPKRCVSQVITRVEKGPPATTHCNLRRCSTGPGSCGAAASKR